jgi:hypothetical protein
MRRTITKTDHVVERKVRDNLILVPMKTGPARLDALYTLNEAASLLWKDIKGETSEDELVTRLLAEYEVNEATARQDVDRILTELAAIGAITLKP